VTDVRPTPRATRLATQHKGPFNGQACPELPAWKPYPHPPVLTVGIVASGLGLAAWQVLTSPVTGLGVLATVVVLELWFEHSAAR
jgi:hypothetical protein